MDTCKQSHPGFEALKTYHSGVQIEGGSAKGVLAPDGLHAWRHKESGVRVILFNAPGPLTSANIVVGTLPVSDGGHPHTLEHIIFLGSERHPARGYLDTLANRSLADGTNAYTDVDRTVYQADCAGFEGLSRLLPAFVDHVLRPRISRAAFVSEVYYTTSTCGEAGVVFCEMHGRENTEDDLAGRALNHALLAGTPLTMSSGGICSHIRQLTPETIQKYHDDYYVGHNVSVIVGGASIDPTALLDSVRPVLDEIAASDKRPRTAIPWHLESRLDPMPIVDRKQVPFPCPDEDIGSVILAWRGPSASQMLEMSALEILLQYLTVSVSSPLRQKFVECEDPLSSHVYFQLEGFLSTCKVSLCFAGVSHRDTGECEEDDDEEIDEEEDECGGDQAEEDTDANEDDVEETSKSMLTSGEFADLVMDYLRSIVTEDKLPGSLKAVQLTIKRERESFLAALEEDSHETVSDMLLDEVLYSDMIDAEIGKWVRGTLARLDELNQKDERYWLDLLKSSLVDAPRFELFMTPDPTLAEKLAEEEKKLTEERIEKHGKEELVQIGKRNEELIASLESVEFGANEFPSLPSAVNLARIPYNVELDLRPEYWAQSTSLDTDFIHTSIFFSTASLSIEQRLVLPLITSLLLKSDVKKDDGTFINFMDSSYAISEVTVGTEMTSINLGYNSGLAQQCLKMHFTSTPSNCLDAFKLVLRSLFKEEVSLERLSTVTRNDMSEITESLRDPVSVLLSGASLLPYVGESSVGTGVFSTPNFVVAGVISEQFFMSKLVDDSNGGVVAKAARKKVVKLINETLNIVRSLPSSEIFVQIAAKEPSLWFNQFKSEWDHYRTVSHPLEATSKLPIRRVLPVQCSARPEVARVIGVPGAENAYIDVRVDSDLYPGQRGWAAMGVLSEMLCRMEGPLGDAIRKAGLAYGYGLSNQRWRGYIRATIDDSATPCVAWVAFLEKLIEYRARMENDKEMIALDIDTAKSIMIYSASTDRSTPEYIVKGAIASAALGNAASPSADQAIVEAVEAVTVEDIVEAFDSHVCRLLEPRGRRAVLTCGRHAVVETIEKFETCKYPISFVQCTPDQLVPDTVREAVHSVCTIENGLESSN